MKVELYDSTLRDGMGGLGISLTAEERLLVAQEIDRLGVDIIEAGFAASGPKESRFFDLLAKEKLDHAQIAAFGMTRRKGRAASSDSNLQLLAQSFAPIITLVGKASRHQAEQVIKVSAEENLAMIEESIAFLRQENKRVIFDAEHFFDGYYQDRQYSLDCLRAALAAETIVLCDTNGGTLPWQIKAAVEEVVRLFPESQIGIHTHNDCGCAVANSLIAIDAGAVQVQGTVNGVGERTGNANLITIIADLQLKMGHPVVSEDQLKRLTVGSRYIDELMNRQPQAAQPFVGRGAFAHKAGMHAQSQADFEHIDPSQVGNQTDILISELSGRSSIIQKSGLTLNDEQLARITERIKNLENNGYQFEDALASFELLINQETGRYKPLFKLESWRVISEKVGSGRVSTEATIKLIVDGQRKISTAEGNGPVNALDRALRQAIVDHHAEIDQVELTNYKVRILNESRGTEAITRVLLDSTAKDESWTTVGVSENVIEASWQALVDSLEHYSQRN